MISHLKPPKLNSNQKTDRKIEQNIQALWDNFKMCNTCAMGISERDGRVKGNGEILETVMSENFLK